MFTDLPEPDRDSLVIYLFGPGFGECQVVAFPDGRWMVVDACRFQGESVPLSLLRHFSVKQVDLLVITHPDLDHVDGLLDILERTDVVRLWRYPDMTLIRELLTRMMQNGSHNNSLPQFARILERIDEFSRSNRAFDVSYGTREWPDGANYQVSTIAPTPHDISRLRASFTKIRSWDSPQVPVLAQQVVDYLTGHRSRFPDHANTASLALTLEYAGHRILLAGDVENGTREKHSGWSGILELLQEDERLDLVTDLAAVKVAHHGSRGAFCADAWQIHSQSRAVPLAVISPFNRGTNPPPHDETLAGLRSYAESLLLTAEQDALQTRVSGSGWHMVEEGRQGVCPVGAIRLKWAEPLTIYHHGHARVYHRTHEVQPQQSPRPLTET